MLTNTIEIPANAYEKPKKTTILKQWAGLLICILASTTGCVNNPVSPEEARKYHGSSGDQAIIIARVVPPRSFTQIERLNWLGSEQNITMQQMIDETHPGRTIRWTMREEEWFVWPLDIGSYCLVGCRIEGEGLNIKRWSTSYIGANFCVPESNTAIYIGSFIPDEAGTWRIEDESNQAGIILPKMVPSCEGSPITNLAKLETQR